MLKCLALTGYTIPMYGSRETLPYGTLLVTDGEIQQQCRIRTADNGMQFITFRYRRYEITRHGDLYRPRYEIGRLIPRSEYVRR